MDILELLKSQDANVSITIKREDLMLFGKFLISEAKKELEERIKAESEEEYLTRKETAELLHINITTLWYWEKRDYLKPVEVGGKRLYKKSDVNKILNKG